MLESLIVLQQHITDYFASNLSQQVLYFEGAAAYKTGASSENFNWVYAQQSQWNAEEVLTQCQEFYGQEGLSFIVMTPVNWVSPSIEAALRHAGYQKTESFVTMFLDLSEASALEELSASVNDIRFMNDHLYEWSSPLLLAFDSTPEINAQYTQAISYALDKGANLQNFSLYRENIPIGSITITINEGIARIDNVGTLPAYQGQGVATKLMRHVLAQAKQQGVDLCFLEASSSGQKVYERLGFKIMYESSTYTKS